VTVSQCHGVPAAALRQLVSGSPSQHWPGNRPGRAYPPARPEPPVSRYGVTDGPGPPDPGVINLKTGTPGPSYPRHSDHDVGSQAAAGARTVTVTVPNPGNLKASKPPPGRPETPIMRPDPPSQRVAMAAASRDRKSRWRHGGTQLNWGSPAQPERREPADSDSARPRRSHPSPP
jgi:hypothetical protein